MSERHARDLSGGNSRPFNARDLSVSSVSSVPSSHRVDFGPHIAALRERFGGSRAADTFRCPIPGHGGLASVGRPDDDPDGDVRLLCCRGRWRSLGEVWAAVGYGRDVRRSNIELAVWTRLLGVEVGAFEPVGVIVPLLPVGESEVVEAVRRFFALVVGVRWADYEPRAVAFSGRFVEATTGIPHAQVARAIRRLLELGVIRQAGKVGRCPTYLPGGGPVTE